ncbi:transporter [Methylobacterium aerolatum]|uniref:CoxB-like protein n=1 Tax=Methylobacterium aerolatum TaxID=418708 RepID=A0ABU0I5J1_9HYPH|nr:transporter [Methylobacterium aerolatum]MDQ0449887.1 hypothetical protein [Methylobacterium aerolatum]GJD37208.1 hypothetical protein FMGBMHLM_4135 [Methylobacterium aerolatum]
MLNGVGCFEKTAWGLALAFVLGWSATPHSAQAGSAALPGQTLGLPTGAKIPVGVYFINLTSFGSRDTLPRNSESVPILPTVAWSTPWDLFGARVQLFVSQPIVFSSPRGARYQSGVGQLLLAGQLAWDLGNDFGVSYFLGGYLPVDTRIVTQEASLTHRFAASYVGNGYNITANLLYGHFLSERSPFGVLYPDYLNLDLTATKKFGKFEFGPVAFGSTDLVTRSAGYRPQGQFAVGALAGYNFGTVNLQAYVTRDLVERNYGGFDTRAWVRAIVPLYQDKSDVAPNRTLVTREQGL